MLSGRPYRTKTQSAAAQMTMDSLSLYPDWYTGRRFITPPKIERPYDFIGWYGCTTSGKTRDGAQVKLLGDIRQQGGLGTGMIPLDNIVGRPTMAGGITDFVDTINLTRETGGSAILRGKTFEMGREAWQGEAVDVLWGDEDPGDFEVYGECQARLTTTRGTIIWSMSPMLGVTPAPVAWPHDGGRGAGIITGETVAATYKKLGLAMRPTHATFPDGGYNFEAGVTVMEERFAAGRLLIASHLAEVFDEYQGYHRVNGLVNKIDDDLLSAIRVLCMDLRFAKMPEQFPQYRRSSSQGPLIARGVDFDVFTGQ
jgi:phage terminase large subunit-like protein